jgi:hypothetical protein
VTGTPRRISLLIALGATAAALAIPAATRPTATAGPPVVTGPPAASPRAPQLTDRWPSATSIALSGALPDGSLYQPLVVVDPDTNVGTSTLTDANGNVVVQLLVRHGPDGVRVVRTLSGDNAPTIAAVAVDRGELFWLESGVDANGTEITTLWHQALAGGPSKQMARDASDVVYLGSQYDLAVSNGQLHWLVAGGTSSAGGGSRNELRSIPVGGGTQTRQRLDQAYALTTWPWLTTSGSGTHGPVQLRDLTTGAVRTVAATQNDLVTCTPVWCRVATYPTPSADPTYAIEHPDGSDHHPIGSTSVIPLNVDVGLYDRFEVLGTAANDPTGAPQRIWLEDLHDFKSVVLDNAGNGMVGGRGNWLWWADGDNEGLTWHLLDLRQLT